MLFAKTFPLRAQHHDAVSYTHLDVYKRQVHALISVAGRLIVMDYGQILAEGEPRAVMGDSRVREVYMGMPVS